MRVYLAVFRARFKTVLRYRAAALAGVFTQVVFGLILVMVLEAWFRNAAGGGGLGGLAGGPGMGLAQAVSYVWLGQAFLALQAWQPDPELRDLVRSGEIGRDLLRPSGMYGLWLARALGWKVAGVLLRCWSIVVFAGLVLPALGFDGIALGRPVSVAGLGCFLVLLPVAAVLSAALTVGISCFQFRQVSAAGANAIAAALSSFFSGLTVPLPLLSGPLARLAEWLPFRGLADLPFRFWTGALPPAALPGVLLVQLGWLALLMAGGRMWVRAGLAGLAVAGG